MSTFLEEYSCGHPVVVYGPDGRHLGIPCGFVIFPDGVAWADDGVVAADYSSHHPHHHLFGAVAAEGGDILCAGHRFAVGHAWDAVLGRAWNSLDLTRDRWRKVHHAQETKLQEERQRLCN